ncbi:F-box/LRR-repeat protein 4 isoform X2 [Prorops nasuta]|uniref:F-box/LRR-repeat protein 4 isoform X2 n=1 Tax=Prorops nasuta TaxID=863751 RepID=UPI0034CEE4CD
MCHSIDLVRVNTERTKSEDEYVTFVEQFVKDVNDFSSQYGSNLSISYTAYNIAGNPSKFPDYGDFPQSFVMRTYGKWWDKAPSKLSDYMLQNNGDFISQDYIDLEYFQEVYPIRVSIYETYNPGSVIGIWAQDSKQQWFQLWSGPPQIVPHKSRIFSPHLQLCDFKTKLLRLEFNHNLLEYYTELDAVLLIGTTKLIIPFDHTYNQNVNNVLKELGCHEYTNSDIYNLTPDYLKANNDLTALKNVLYKYCTLYTSEFINNISTGKLISKLGLHCYCIPPIEEAFNSLQKFLQEDFPKLTGDIHLSNNQKVLTSCNNFNNYTCGSFSTLPDETVLKILKYLDIKSLCRLCRVNKHFNNIAQDALLYTSLNLKPYWHCLNSNALDYLLPRCQYLQRLDLSWCGNYGMIKYDDVTRFISAFGSSLTHLRLNCCQFVNDNVIFEISRTCKNLKGITADGFSHLKTLKFLERLELYRTAIGTSTLCSILKNNTELKHLNLAGMHENMNMDEIATELGASCLSLESVDFWKGHLLTSNGVRALSYCTKLREVDFGWCGGMGAPGDSLRALFSSCRNLEKVYLAALRGLTDRDLEPLLLCENLQQLDLLGARSLTLDICYGFLLCCSKLKMIDLSFCEGISDVKIQEWSQQYPYVSIKRSYQASCI